MLSMAVGLRSRPEGWPLHYKCYDTENLKQTYRGNDARYVNRRGRLRNRSRSRRGEYRRWREGQGLEHGSQGADGVESRGLENRGCDPR